MRKHGDAAQQAGLCPETLDEVATLVRSEADEYGELARARCRAHGAATATYAAADADAQSRALHELARTLEFMALRCKAEET